jgi:small-conductance mechanosensitive channel
MDLFETVIWGNTLMTWLAAVAVAILVVVLLSFAKRIVIRRLGAFAKTTTTDLDDLFVDLIKRIKIVFLLAIGIYFGTYALELGSTAVQTVQTIVILTMLFQGAVWGNGIISYGINRTVKKRVAEDAASATTLAAMGFISKLVMWSIILLLALDNLGIDITALIAGLGIGGIAVALALQNILGDLFASLSIVLDKPFVIGDFIIVDQYLGTVEYIGLKTTRIRSLSGEQVIFSNADLLRSRVRNFKRMYERRVVFSIGVTYQTPHEKLSTIGAMMREIIESKQDTRFDRAHFQSYGDSALVFEIVYFVKRPEFNVYMDIQQAINLEIYRRFQDEGIDFAYPTRTVYVQNSNNLQPAPETTGAH